MTKPNMMSPQFCPSSGHTAQLATPIRFEVALHA